MEYSVASDDQGNNFIIADTLLANVQTKLNKSLTVTHRFKGSDISGAVCRHPFINRASPILEVLQHYDLIVLGTRY
jgi:isoleucyl-tRNA synthetase